jgi:putative endonuclease
MTAGWVYFMTNRPNGILYVGVTDNLPRRAWEHREGLIDGFTKRYGLKRLVYFREVRRHPLRAATRAEPEALLARLESPPHPAE